MLVATIRALKMHGGVAKDALKAENVEALEKGFANLKKHVENLQRYGVPVVVSINRFSTDTDAEVALLNKLCAGVGVKCVLADHWAAGSEGATDLARTVVETIEKTPSKFKPLYPDDMKLWDKVKTIAQEIYGASDITADKSVKDRLAELEKEGFGNFPICVAKTQYSFTTNVDAEGRAYGIHHPDPRGQAVGRRRVHRGDLRGHHDHARSAQGSGRQQYRACGGRPHQRAVLVR